MLNTKHAIANIEVTLEIKYEDRVKIFFLKKEKATSVGPSNMEDMLELKIRSSCFENQNAKLEFENQNAKNTFENQDAKLAF